eukprot:gb/GECH01012461.1/.p1 GENE.gb/GECH01012461.1/~~gb/GECH01012461.1/.p1  ORF type:complete len:533 (+),score=161.12 gb/GECH01012461.1/:1-1599(+)
MFFSFFFFFEMKTFLLSILTVAILLFCGVVIGQEEVDVDGPYQAPNPKDHVLFLENFNEDFHGRWKVIQNEKYQGKWSWSRPSTRVGIKNDYGLLLTKEARHYAIVKDLEKPIDNQDIDLVIQYEVKVQETYKCGGAYLKLLPEDVDTDEFDNETPYLIMFGPDRCGSETNKVHFIVRRPDDKTGEWEEKHATDVPSVPLDQKTHLYTVAIFKNGTYHMYVNQELKREGSLAHDFDPPIQPPEQVDDPEDKKPEDWVDDPKMPDPDAVKPDDWDEDEPEKIPDPNDVKPEDWDEDAPLFVPDPNAKKPEDWDDEEDGEWVAPQIRNPECEEHGCGPYEPRMIPNPKYKGKWEPPLIDNPDYIGEWKPRQIPNPSYYRVGDPHRLHRKIGAIGLELWSMQGKILFDNFIITDDLNAAMKYADQTWRLKVTEEEKKDPSVEDEKSITEQYMDLITNWIDLAINEYPVYALGGGLGGILTLVLLTLVCCTGSSSIKTDDVGKKKKDEGNDSKSGESKAKKDSEESSVRKRSRKDN